MKIDSKFAVKSEIDSEDSDKDSIWPEPIGSKEWFKRYVGMIADYSSRPGRMTDEKSQEIFNGLQKFDPKFASLCKAAHDSANEFMDYTLSKVEKKS